jgi:hypothetical protein
MASADMSGAPSQSARTEPFPRGLRLVLILLAGIVLLMAACAPRVPVPPTGPHRQDTPELVPYPPPPARVELIPPAPAPEALWIDGHWIWTAGGYAWHAGRWEPARVGAHYAPATTVRRSNGELLYYVGSWQSDPAPTASDGE